MKGNRDMIYGNYNMGAYTEPQFIPPQGYNINTQYQAYGPNVIPNNNMIMNNTNPYNNTNTNYSDNFETRINRLERQIRSLDARLKKLEAGTNLTDDTIVDSNLYMI